MAIVWLVLLSVTSLVSAQDGKLCYDYCGCFDLGYPWFKIDTRPCPPPQSPMFMDVSVSCYNRTSDKGITIALWPKMCLEGCPFKSLTHLVFVVHGYINSGSTDWLHEVKDNYLAMDKSATVCIVDWGKGAMTLSYPQAVSNTRVVGALLARHINCMLEKCEVKTSDIHLIGHSLGAHICGYTAKQCPGIANFTALDPAQPGFQGMPSEVRMSKDDAQFVQVFHTNSDRTGFGYMPSCGHVDYYFNGGAHQPGCGMPPTDMKLDNMADIMNMTTEVIGNMVACSHCRAIEYFKYQQTSGCRFWGYKTSFALPHFSVSAALGIPDLDTTNCDSDTCVLVGQVKARGKFYVRTGSQPPFCKPDNTWNEISNIWKEFKQLG